MQVYFAIFLAVFFFEGELKIHIFFEANFASVLHSTSSANIQTKVSNNKCSRQELKCYGWQALLISSSTQM